MHFSQTNAFGRRSIMRGLRWARGKVSKRMENLFFSALYTQGIG